METKGKKYGFTGETKQVGNHTLHKIYALERFKTKTGYVEENEKGGYIESEANLSQEGGCWVADTALVYGNAQVKDNAIVMFHSVVRDNAQIKDNATVNGAAVVADDVVVQDFANVEGNCTVNECARIGGHAHICEDAHIHDNAEVFGRAVISGEAEIYENAHISGEAKVSDNAEVFGNAFVVDYANIYHNAKVYGHALVSNMASVFCDAKVYDYAKISSHSKVYGNAQVCEHACVWGESTVCDDAIVKGLAHLYEKTRVCGNACVEGTVKVYGNHMIMDGTYDKNEDFPFLNKVDNDKKFVISKEEQIMENAGRVSVLNTQKSNDKYRLIPDKEEPDRYYRPVALRNFGDVRVNDIGGRVSSAKNLSQKGNCWVYDGMTVCNEARVEGDAKVMANTFSSLTEGNVISGHALVKDNAVVLGGYICGNVQISGNAYVENGIVSENARIGDRASVYNSYVKDSAEIGGNASVAVYSDISGNATVKGYTNLKHIEVTDNAIVDGNASLNVTSLDEKSFNCLLTIKDNAHITGTTFIEFTGESTKDPHSRAIIGKNSVVSVAYVQNLEDMKVLEKELDIKQNRVLDKNAVITGIAISFEKCSLREVDEAMKKLFYEHGADFGKKFGAELLADDICRNGLVFMDSDFKDNRYFDNTKLHFAKLFEQNEFDSGQYSGTGVCSLKYDKANVPGKFKMECEYIAPWDEERQEFNSEMASDKEIYPVHIDACKLALYLEKECGLDIVLRDVEYGKVNKNGKFIEFHSEVRPQWADEFNKKHKKRSLAKKVDKIKDKDNTKDNEINK